MGDDEPIIDLKLDELDATIQTQIVKAKMFLLQHGYVCISASNWRSMLRRRAIVFIMGMAVAWLIGALYGLLAFYITSCPK